MVTMCRQSTQSGLVVQVIYSLDEDLSVNIKNNQPNKQNLYVTYGITTSIKAFT